MGRRRVLGAVGGTFATCCLLFACDAILGIGDLDLANGSAADAAWDVPQVGFDASRFDAQADVFTRKRVFVTTATVTGNIGSAQAAHAKCTEAARAANLGNGAWLAWISDDGNRTYDRLPFNSSYELVNGTPVAPNKTTLIDGGLAVPINIHEDGKPFAGDLKGVWTGTRSDGRIGETCKNWIDGTTSALGTVGFLDQKDGKWTDNGGQPLISAYGWHCSWGAHLYCFEQ